MTAVTVTFGLTWLTNPITRVSVTAPNPVRAGNASRGGSFRVYAGGRIRVITTPTDIRTYPVVMQSLSDASLLLLDSWRGQVVLLRDASGWRKFGSFLDMKWNDAPGPSGMIHDVSLTFQEISYSEAV
jgi:hypothetical protein